MSAVQRRLSLAYFHVGHGLQLQSAGARGLFLNFLNQAANGVGRLGAARDPMLSAIDLDRAIIAFQFRIVGADDLDEFSVARAAFIDHDDFVIRAIQRALSS